jgi:hypothetical protein
MDGRTDAMALFHLAFKRSRFTDCISPDSDRRERRNKSLACCATREFGLFFASNTPYALHQRYLFSSYGSGRFGIERGRLPRRSALWRYKVRIHSFRLIRLLCSVSHSYQSKISSHFIRRSLAIVRSCPTCYYGASRVHSLRTRSSLRSR